MAVSPGEAPQVPLPAPSQAVRGAALDAIAGCGQDALVEQAMRMLVDGGFADTPVRACRRHPAARQVLLAMLRKTDTISGQGLLTILEAMGHAVDARQEAPVEDGGERVKPPCRRSRDGNAGSAYWVFLQTYDKRTKL